MRETKTMNNSSAVDIPIWRIKTSFPFKGLFPIQDSVLGRIISEMRCNGFNPAHPLIVWGTEHLILIDGHARLKAALEVGIDRVPVVIRDFSDETAALEYAINAQRNRRNLSPAEMLRCIAELDKLKKRGPKELPDDPLGKSAVALAKALGISSRQVEKLRAIGKFASDEVKEALASGKYAVSRAYEETMRTRRPREFFLPDPDAKVVHSVMAEIHARMNGVQIRKLVKALQLELATN